MFQDDDLEMRDDGDDEEDITPEQWQEGCWIVISSYFDEKGNFAFSGVV